MSALLVRHGPKLAVGGLVLLNLVLIGALVLRGPVRTAVPADPVPSSSISTPSSTPSSAASSPTPSASPSTSSTPSTSPSASSDKPKKKKAAEPARLLAANSAQVAWRAKSTDCKGDAKVEVTTNGGKSWSRTDPGLTAIVRLKAYGDGSVFAIGADNKCRPTYAWITGPTEIWQQDRSRVDTIWFQTPDDLDEVHAPGGRTTKPCGDDLVDFAGFGTLEAAARCADDRIRTTTNGRLWNTVQKNSEVISLNADDNGFVAAGTSEGCKGVVVRRFESAGQGLRARGTCRPKVKADGSTVVSIRSQDTWLWFDDSVETY